MPLKPLTTIWVMTLKELLRSRFVIILFFVIPTIFFILTDLTTSEKQIFFKLAAVSDESMIEVSQKQTALVFIGLAAVGLLAAFIAMNFIQKNTAVNRRLILCGYRTSSLIFAKLLVLLSVMVVIASYVTGILNFYFKPEYCLSLWLGFVALAYVYGSYGLLVGALVRRELEGILFVVLITNIDVGWLQNPIYYDDAGHKEIIRNLPAFFPSQVSMISAFTDNHISYPLFSAFIYGTALLFCALSVYWWKMKLARV